MPTTISRRPRLRTLALALAMTTAVPVAAAASPPTASHGTNHVLVIGVDGLMRPKVSAAEAPTLQRLGREGLLGQSLLYAQPLAATSSGPGWTTLLTGTWPDQHGVRDNSFIGQQTDEHPGFLTRAERALPHVQTWAGVDWKPIGDPVLSDEVDEKLVLDGDYRTNDRRIAQEAAEHLRTARADATFAYFGQQDIVGHSSSAASDAYLAEIANVDAYVARMLRAIEQRPDRERENWLVLLGADSNIVVTVPRAANGPADRLRPAVAER